MRREETASERLQETARDKDRLEKGLMMTKRLYLILTLVTKYKKLKLCSQYNLHEETTQLIKKPSAILLPASVPPLKY